MLTVNDQISIPLKELQFDFVRSSGPGGQNVNKVNTKVVLNWPVERSESLPSDVRRRFVEKFSRRINQRGELVITSQRFRDRGRNVADCLEKLRQMVLGVATPPKRRRPTRPTRTSKEKRLKQKRQRAEKKQRRGSVRRED